MLNLLEDEDQTSGRRHQQPGERGGTVYSICINIYMGYIQCVRVSVQFDLSLPSGQKEVINAALSLWF